VFSETLSPGVQLRPLETWNAAEFAEHLDRAREHIRPWVGPAFVTDTVEGARATLLRYGHSTAADGPRIYGLWDDGVLVGGVMFVAFDAAWGVCEIGCWLEPAGVGKGSVTRAVERLVRWAFDERGMTRVEWRCRTDNDRSVAVARRLGMRSEGVLRSSWIYDGRRYDKEVFALLSDEWPVAALE
jgi:ribosomal-protein-serine acetyltransferase